MLKIILIFLLASGILFSQTKLDSVNVDYLKSKYSIEYKSPTFLRVTGQFFLGTFLGLGGMVTGQVHGSLAPIGFMFCSSFGVNIVGGTKGSSYWWTFGAGAFAMTPFAVAMLSEDHPLGVAALAFLGIITSVTSEIIVYWLTKDYGESDAETNVAITQRKIDISNFQSSNKHFNLAKPEISIPLFHINF